MTQGAADTNSDAGGRATPEQMARQHVFVVNRSPEFLDIIRQLLEASSYNVTTTNFMPLSFQTIEAARPSLLVIDLVPGERAGWDLLARIRRAASTRGIPVVLVSTSPTLLIQAQDHSHEFGGDHYLLKPFDLEDLLLLVEETIGRA